jgi:hypothetical protein
MPHTHNRSLPSAAALALAGMIAAAPAARAHQCVDVDLLRAPDRAQAGEMIVAEGSVTNCGDPARGFLIAWVLVDQLGDRIQLRRTVAQVEPGETETGFVRLLLPERLRPGMYALVMVGEAPSGFTDSDVQRIAIGPPGR